MIFCLRKTPHVCNSQWHFYYFSMSMSLMPCKDYSRSRGLDTRKSFRFHALHQSCPDFIGVFWNILSCSSMDFGNDSTFSISVYRPREWLMVHIIAVLLDKSTFRHQQLSVSQQNCCISWHLKTVQMKFLLNKFFMQSHPL